MGQRPVFNSQNSSVFSKSAEINKGGGHASTSSEIPDYYCPVNSLPMPFVEIDIAEACIVSANDSFVQATGFSLKRLLKNKDLSSLFDLDTDFLIAFIAQAADGGPWDVNLPVKINTRSGEQIHSMVRTQVVFRNNTPYRLTGLFSEVVIPHQEDMERLRLKAAVRGSNDAVGMANAQGRHFYHNEAFSRMFGYSLKELSSQHPGFLYCSQDQAREVFQTIEKGQYWSGEVKMLTKSGKVIHVALRADGITNSEGRVIALIGHHADITENKRAVSQLAQSEAKYKDFIENAPIGMLITNMAGHVVYANKKLEEITGYDRRDWINTPFIPFLYPEDLPLMFQQREHAIKHKKNVRPYELRVIHASGEIRWLRTIPQLIFQEAPNTPGEIIGFQNFLEDITPTKMALEEKARLEKQLVQSQKMQAIGTMAGGIAHDFNNILYPIMGYAELLKDDLTPGTLPYRNVVEIEKSAHRAKDLVQQILSFSRPTEQEVVPVAIQAVLEDVLRMVRAAFPSTIQIHKKIGRQCRMILADPTQVHQVLLNLCTNAYHAMLENGGVLHVCLREEEIGHDTNTATWPLEPGSYARLTIQDTGGGIPRDIIDRIFEPYFTTKVAGEGTGLGLATVLAIMEKLNGHIVADSELGKGSVFDVYFPILPMALSMPEETDSAPVPKGKESIMVVDDEESILNMLAQMLHRLGYKVTCFLNSQRALHAFSEKPEAFDLVITDLTMPKLTGVGLAKKMFEINPSLPIILCTGYTEMITASEVEKLGIKALLCKPAIYGDLGTAIRNALSR